MLPDCLGEQPDLRFTREDDQHDMNVMVQRELAKKSFKAFPVVASWSSLLKSLPSRMITAERSSPETRLIEEESCMTSKFAAFASI